LKYVAFKERNILFAILCRLSPVSIGRVSTFISWYFVGRVFAARVSRKLAEKSRSRKRGRFLSVRHEHTCQAVDDAAAVNGAVGRTGLVENFFVRQRLLQDCQPTHNDARNALTIDSYRRTWAVFNVPLTTASPPRLVAEFQQKAASQGRILSRQAKFSVTPAGREPTRRIELSILQQRRQWRLFMLLNSVDNPQNFLLPLSICTFIYYSLHSLNEPGELSQWLRHDDSTINIISVIIIIIITWFPGPTQIGSQTAYRSVQLLLQGSRT